MEPRPSNIRIVTLGCAKNEVDSEEIAGVLAEAGHSINATQAADVTIVNTCGFIESAINESLQAIRTAVQEKGEGKVVVAGCLAQRMGHKLAEAVPGIDVLVGVGQMARFGTIVEGARSSTQPLVEEKRPEHLWASIGTRARTGQPWSAYLKVSEGCDHKCTFCTIPSFRGGHQSKPLERVVQEASALAAEGVKEVNLIAQDVTQYGYDLYREFTLPRLLRELDAIEGIEWVRLLYFYPNRLTDEVIESMAGLPSVLPYIDIPLQHVHGDILRAMKRPWDGERYLRLFEKVRKAMPGAAIRTTFIVGFPGETEEHFETLLDWVREARLDRVGAFAYSRERGTPAAELPGQVPFLVKRNRYERLMRLQQAVGLENGQIWIGREVDVLLESETSGRTYRDAPEIDGKIDLDFSAQPGTLVRAKVTDASVHDLVGTRA
ncbi:MAG: 30S ribosomal protein S12 methylthiotransferase RimO [Fimbriimonadaceae bacterium]|nr:30S ribosomal protein S12 methylthiotransferase RimO [Fimbriimonadaceae bacterium]